MEADNEFQLGDSIEGLAIGRGIKNKKLMSRVTIARAEKIGDDITVTGTLAFPRRYWDCRCEVSFPESQHPEVKPGETTVKIKICKGCASIHDDFQSSDEENFRLATAVWKKKWANVIPEPDSPQSSDTLSIDISPERLEELEIGKWKRESKAAQTESGQQKIEPGQSAMVVAPKKSKRKKHVKITEPIHVADPKEGIIAIALPDDPTDRMVHESIRVLCNYTAERCHQVMMAPVNQGTVENIAKDLDRIGHAATRIFNAYEHTTSAPIREVLNQSKDYDDAYDVPVIPDSIVTDDENDAVPRKAGEKSQPKPPAQQRLSAVQEGSIWPNRGGRRGRGRPRKR